MSVTSDADKKELYIDDIGVTFRTLLAVAAKGYADSQVRRWHVVYKGARIGIVQVKTERKRVDLVATKPTNLKGNPNARYENRNAESSRSRTTAAQATKRANLALVAGPSPKFCQDAGSGAEGKAPDGSVQSD